MLELKSRPLCRLELELGALIDAGETPFGKRRIVPVTGGRFEGERLRGEGWVTVSALGADEPAPGCSHYWDGAAAIEGQADG